MVGIVDNVRALMYGMLGGVIVPVVRDGIWPVLQTSLQGIAWGTGVGVGVAIPGYGIYAKVRSVWHGRSFTDIVQADLFEDKYCEVYQPNIEKCRPYINLFNKSSDSFLEREKEAIKQDFIRLNEDIRAFVEANPDIIKAAGISVGTALGYFAIKEAFKESEEDKIKNHIHAGLLGAASGAVFYGTYLANNAVNPLPETTVEATKGFFEATQESIRQLGAQAKNLVENYGLDALSYSAIVTGGALAYLATKKVLNQSKEVDSTEEKVESSDLLNKKAWVMGIAAATAIAAGSIGLISSQ